MEDSPEMRVISWRTALDRKVVLLVGWRQSHWSRARHAPLQSGKPPANVLYDLAAGLPTNQGYKNMRRKHERSGNQRRRYSSLTMNRFVHENVQRILVEEGYEVEGALRVDQALDLLAKGSYDLVLQT